MAKVFCVMNQKGGVGKTSCCFHLAGGYAALGHRVLAIDVDPQGSLSQGFLGSSTVERLAVSETVAALFEESWGFADWEKLIHRTPFERIDLCPANQTLADFNDPRPEELGLGQYSLREFICEQDAYDIILVDCPPNLARCSWAAMIAAEWIIIPVNPEDFGTQGLRAVHQAIEQAQTLNPRLNRLGHLITRCDTRLGVHKAYEAKLREHYGDVLSHRMLELSAFKIAVAARKPASQNDCRSRAASLTETLCHEILDRSNDRNDGRRVA